MLRIKQRGLDLFVTPDHRLWTQKMLEGGRWSPWHFTTAETVSARGIWRFRRDSTLVRGTIGSDECVIPARDYRSGRRDAGYETRVQKTRELRMPVLAYAKFLGYVIAEGYAYVPTGSGSPYVGITQSKGPVLDDILSVIDELGLSYGEYSDPRKPQVVTLHVHGGRDFVRRVREDSGSGARNKRIPRWLMEHSDLQLCPLVPMWAGTAAWPERSQYSTCRAPVTYGQLLSGSGRPLRCLHDRDGTHYRGALHGIIASRGRSWEPYRPVDVFRRPWIV